MISTKAPCSDDIRQRLADVRGSIERSARSCGRAPEEVKLIAVTKTHPVETLKRAIDAGLIDLGENRVQEADAKISELGRDAARWHLIGHLQRNKARRAIQLFNVIHSLDSESLARRLDGLCEEAGRDELAVLIQLDLAGETTKTGATEKELPGITTVIRNSRRLRLIGLMTLPPFFRDAEKVRPYFRRLRELRDALKTEGAFGDGLGELSMGMSNDFVVAIEEGATFVRVGTAIFGDRHTTAN